MCKCPECSTKLYAVFDDENNPDVAHLICPNCKWEGEMIC